MESPNQRTTAAPTEQQPRTDSGASPSPATVAPKTADPSTEHTAGTFDPSTSECVECGDDSFTRTPAGEWFCDDCGTIHSSSAVDRSEPIWTPRSERRTGPGSSHAHLAVGTRIGKSAGAATPHWARLNQRLSSGQQTLRHGLKELRALTASLEAAESVTEHAAYLFRKAAADGLLVGGSIEAVAAATVHASARELGAPFPLKQLAGQSPVDESTIRSAFSKLVQEFELRVAPPLPTAFIRRIGSAVGASHETWRRAEQLTSRLVEAEDHVGQSPTGLAAAALYGAAKEHHEDISQQELADAAFVSVVTISRHWQTVQEYTHRSG